MELMRAILETLKHNMRQALGQGRVEEAKEILARLRQEDPVNPDTRGLELEFYLDTDRLDEAAALARQLCHLFPDSGHILFLTGKVAYRQKHYEEAEARFRESLRVFPHYYTQQWLGKTLTQSGRFEEAESLLLSAGEHNRLVLLDLAWLYERKNDLAAALKACDAYLEHNPDDAFAGEQRVRIRARMQEPEALIEEMSALADLGEQPSDALFPEYVQKLFETGQGPRAREEISARMKTLEARPAVRVAWVCYRAQAYDLAAALFLSQLQANHSNYKYLNALESAAVRCNRLSQVLEAYQGLVTEAGHLHGRCRSLAKRVQR